MPNHGSERPASQTEEDMQLANFEGEEDATDTSLIAKMGGDAVHAYGTTLGAAASGVLMDVDIDEARQRLRDAQTALVALGYAVGDGDDPAAAIDGVWGPATRDAVAEFQDEHDLDGNGQLDGDTYELLLNNYEEALSTQAPAVLQDDFSPLHANQPLSQYGVDTLTGQMQEVTDNSSVELLSLHDDFAEFGEFDTMGEE